jgi:hypothetical protein
MPKMLNNVPYIPDFSRLNPQEVKKNLERIRRDLEKIVSREDRSKISLQDILKLEKTCLAIHAGIQKNRQANTTIEDDFKMTFTAIEKLKQAKIADMRELT